MTSNRIINNDIEQMTEQINIKDMVRNGINAEIARNAGYLKASDIIEVQNLADKLKDKAKVAEQSNKKLFDKLKRTKPKNIDDVVHQLHDEAFEEIDCLKCANCCKTTSPIFYERDIDRAAKRLRIRPADFIQKYLHIDEDKDYVLQSVPCTFLDHENYCMIYDVRPKACREFPHTDRKKFQQISDLTLKNVAICPAAYNIVEEMKKRLPL